MNKNTEFFEMKKYLFCFAAFVIMTGCSSVYASGNSNTAGGKEKIALLSAGR